MSYTPARDLCSLGRSHGGPDSTVVQLTGTMQGVTERNEAASEMARVATELLQVNRLNADVMAMLGTTSAPHWR